MRLPARERVRHVWKGLRKRGLIESARGFLLFRLLNRYWRFRTHEFVAETEFGSLIAGSTREVIGRYLCYFGVWEPNTSQWIANQLRPGDTFIDVGAHIGYYSLLASKCVGSTGRVIAIEASPQNYTALKANLERNNVTNVRAVNAAVSDRAGTLTLYHDPNRNAGLTTTIPQPGFEAECQVSANTLSALLKSGELESARLIKIDVEGAEAAVLSDLVSTLDRLSPTCEVVAEIAPDRAADGKDLDAALMSLQRAGFRTYAIENEYYPSNYYPLTYCSPRRYAPPRLVEGRVHEQTDIIFSRGNPLHAANSVV